MSEETTRSIDSCPYRRPPGGGGNADEAICDLLVQLTGVDEPELCRVRVEACEACCRSFPPSARELNPVVASFLYRLARGIAETGGAPGCGPAVARELEALAVENLPSQRDVSRPIPAPSGPGSRSAPLFEQHIPRPWSRCGPQVRKWAVGVTTAPRGAPTLSTCLASVLKGGWPNPRLFVDGEVVIPDQFDALPRTEHRPNLGAWSNYYLALGELLLREPAADAYLLLQDDALIVECVGLREYLEQVLWPGSRPGIASLFCSRAYTRERPGWYCFDGVWVRGALAFVFSREAAQEFLMDFEVVRHRWTRRRNPMADIDWRVGQWAYAADVPVYYPTPSLIQHIGDVSALWRGRRSFGSRRADWVVGQSRST